jgi:serine/threonine protein kinase
VTAHVHIRTAEALKKDDGIVRFYGCFSHGDTFSIFMEWASQGNLEQLLKTPPPTDVQGIWDFWNSYLRLLTTLNCLRKITYPDSSEIQMLVPY